MYHICKLQAGIATVCLNAIGNQDEDALLHTQLYQSSRRHYRSFSQACAEDNWRVTCLIKAESALPKKEEDAQSEWLRQRSYVSSWHWIYLPQCDYCTNFSVNVYFFDQERRAEVSEEVIAMIDRLKVEAGDSEREDRWRSFALDFDQYSQCDALAPIRSQEYKYRQKPRGRSWR